MPQAAGWEWTRLEPALSRQGVRILAQGPDIGHAVLAPGRPALDDPDLYPRGHGPIPGRQRVKASSQARA